MIKWHKIEAGKYESEDKRFHIEKVYDRVYGDHWRLRDESIEDFYKQQFHEKTLLACKVKAEDLYRPINSVVLGNKDT